MHLTRSEKVVYSLKDVQKILTNFYREVYRGGHHTVYCDGKVHVRVYDSPCNSCIDDNPLVEIELFACDCYKYQKENTMATLITLKQGSPTVSEILEKAKIDDLDHVIVLGRKGTNITMSTTYTENKDVLWMVANLISNIMGSR